MFAFSFSTVRSTLLLFVTAWLLAGCGSGFEIADTAKAPNSIQVANLVGPPEEVRTRVLSAIGARGQSEGLNIAIEGNGPSEFTIAGYMTAVSEANSTEIAYVWDVADTTGERTHRVTGTVTGKRNDDPWQAVDTEVANKIAQDLVSDLKAWRGQSEPSTPPADTPTPPTPPAATPEETSPAVALVATATSEAPQVSAKPEVTRRSRSAPILALASANEQSRRLQRARNSGRATRRASTIALVNVTGTSDSARKSLADGLRKSLGARGLSVTTDPQAAGYRLIADVTSTPPERGRQAVAIIWTVNDQRGSQLGTVRQVNRLPPKKAQADWPSAAEAASNGIVSLILANPVQ